MGTCEWAEFLSVKCFEILGYKGELQNFARSCLGLDKPRATLWDGAKDLQISEAVWQSTTSHKVVRLK